MLGAYYKTSSVSIITMSLRRSARVQALPATAAMPAPTEKRKPVARKTTTGKRKAKQTENIAASAIGQDGEDHDGAIPEMAPLEIAKVSPNTTPNKRRRTTKDEEPPPITPTPAAIAFMTKRTPAPKTYSSGDIDDATPPPEDRPAEPHHTNATLITPFGTQHHHQNNIYSNFEDASPTKPAAPHPPSSTLTSTATLLAKATTHLISADPTGKLAPLIDAHPCRVFSPAGLAEEIDPFRSLASGIMAQQVSGAAAKSIKNKFIALFSPADSPNGFPTPAVVAETPLARLREAGLSGRKAEYIQGLAGKFVSRELTVKMLMEGGDEEVMRELVAVRGLGKWSVEMFMCFGLKRMDVLSVGDLGVERGMAAYVGRDVARLKAKGGKRKYMSEKDMLEIAEKFSPFRWVSLF